MTGKSVGRKKLNLYRCVSPRLAQCLCRSFNSALSVTLPSLPTCSSIPFFKVSLIDLVPALAFLETISYEPGASLDLLQMGSMVPFSKLDSVRFAEEQAVRTAIRGRVNSLNFTFFWYQRFVGIGTDLLVRRKTAHK